MKTKKLTSKLTYVLSTAVLLFRLIFSWLPVSAATTSFISTWKTDNEGVSGPSQIAIPTNPSETYNYFVDWGDGQTSSGVTGGVVHSYATAGTYTVRISGLFPRIYFANGGDRNKILSIEQWGNNAWTSGEAAFQGASNLVINAHDTPNLSLAKNLTYMFQDAKALNGGVENWNVSNIEGFGYMFAGATSFNANIRNWNMANAVNTEYMFYQASMFNQNIGNWNMARVGNTKAMFYGASSFNQSLNNWDMSQVFNVEDMFRNAAAYDSSISQWNIGKIMYTSRLLSGSALSTAAYDEMLSAWAINQTATNVKFDAGRSMYCRASDARDHLVNKLGWKITDGGADNVFCGGVDVNFSSVPNLKEGQPAGSSVGTLKVSTSVPSTFSLSLCSSNPVDTKFFELKQGVVYTKQAFDFENPLDENKDNFYEICVTLTSQSTGASINKFVLVNVQNIPDSQETTASQAPVVPAPGQVLGTATTEATTASAGTGGKVLGATGAVIGLGAMYFGLGLSGVTLFAGKRPKHPAKKR